MQPAQPRDAALDPHAEPRVGHGAEASEIQVPVEAPAGETVPGNAPPQRRETLPPLTTADDLAVAVGGEDVDAQREARIGGIRLHVERLRGERIAMNHDGTIELLRERGLGFR